MPLPPARSGAGQASPEYVAILAVVAAVLAGAGAGVASPDLPGALVRHAKTALCIVGGDVCRHADARAAGLEPCVVRDATRHDHGGVTIGFFRAEGGDVWTVERRSDGSVAFTAADELGGGVMAGVGGEIEIDSIHASYKADLAASTGRRRGKTWVFRDLAAAQGFLAVMEREQFDPDAEGVPPPRHRFSVRKKDIAAAFSTLGFPVAGAGVGLATGTRHGPDGVSLTFDGSLTGPQLLDGLLSAGEHHAQIELLADPEGHRPKRFAVVAIQKGPGPGQVTETTVTLPLLDADDRRAVGDILRLRSPVAVVRDLNRRLKARGVVERNVFRIQRAEPEGYKLDLGIGPKLAIADQRDRYVKDLVSATIRFPGDTADRRRADCA